jgi:hypothetical protein
MNMHSNSPFPMYLKTRLKYGYFDVIEINIYYFPISSHDATKHFKTFLKYSSKKIIYILIFGILKSP